MIKQIKYNRLILPLENILDRCYMLESERYKLTHYYIRNDDVEYCLFYIYDGVLLVFRDEIVKQGVSEQISEIEIEQIIRRKFRL